MTKQEFLAASLPYGLKCELEFRPDSEIPYYYEQEQGKLFTLEGMMLDWYGNEIIKITPIVRPLSDLTKPITQANYNEGKLFVPLYRLLENSGFNVSKMTEAEILEYAEVYSNIDLIQLSDLHLYLIWHFDLLDEGIEKVLVTDEFNPY